MKISTPNSDNIIKTIYCMGTGRSGSTLLSIILGNHPKLVSPGECYTVHRLSQDNFKCSCGERVEKCSFWAPTISKWRIVCGEEAVNRTMFRMKAIENFKSPIAWLKAILNYPGQKKYFYEYLECTYIFFKLILQESDKAVMVDISKNPLRAFLLMKHPCIDFRLIHLVRDGRALAWSLHKLAKRGSNYKPVWRVAIFWIIVNRLSNYVRKKANRGVIIKYEDLLANPESTLNKIAVMAEIDPKPLLEIIHGELAQEDNHIMEGNRLRKQKSIKLKLDTTWRERLSPKEQKLFLKIAKNTLSNYDYI